MPIENNKYVAPGWVNDTTPAINATEMNAISNTLACVPIANGGTGGTTAQAARNNLGFTTTGNANTPVYFNSSGLPTQMTGQLPIEKGGSGMSGVITVKESENGRSIFYKWGKVVMWYYRSTDPLVTIRTMEGYVPSSCRPIAGVYLFVAGTTTNGTEQDQLQTPRLYYRVIIRTNGNVDMIAPNGNTASYYPKFTATWLIA